ncbi:fatty acid desaturase [bacterium CG_4_9_14_3_um_filter_65_15]|nr:MAG: fatty acid desaturase [bacterium CG_4_9_14_3_um_filter_65_15]
MSNLVSTKGIGRPDWIRSVAEFNRSDTRKAVWQLINTVVPYLAAMGLMVFSVLRGWPYPVTLALAVPAAGLAIRLFILFHDCCHDSFFTSRRANRIMGYITGILTFTPYDSWRNAHNTHHATAGNLDSRGTGDVWTMTVSEYLASSRLKRLGYRLVRNPFFLLLVVPFWLSMIAYRIPQRNGGPNAAASVWITNLGLAVIFGVAALTVGWQTYVLVQVPVVLLAWSAGVWLFYVQHQHEDAYWEAEDRCDPLKAALQGSSYYKLPRVLQWVSGNIGLHHIHHLRPRIPNYHLQRCQDAVPALQKVRPLTLRRSLKSVAMNLWDEETRQMVSFGAIGSRARTG